MSVDRAQAFSDIYTWVSMVGLGIDGNDPDKHIWERLADALDSVAAKNNPDDPDHEECCRWWEEHVEADDYFPAAREVISLFEKRCMA